MQIARIAGHHGKEDDRCLGLDVQCAPSPEFMINVVLEEYPGMRQQLRAPQQHILLAT